MKTLLSITILLTSTISGFTQISKGQFLIGGNINFESIKNEFSTSSYNNQTHYTISPNIGYFIIDKLAGGLRIGFDSYDSKSGTTSSNTGISTTKFTESLISPFLRFYGMPKTKKVNAFVEVSYVQTQTKFDNPSNSAFDRKAKGYCISVGPSIFLTDHIALEFTFGFQHTTSDVNGGTKTKTFKSGLGLQIHIGKSKNKKRP